jgi:predicted nucleic acid-binding protein
LILYLDSSALLKRYFDEEGSAEILSLWRESRVAASSAVAYAECLAAIQRKTRESGKTAEAGDLAVAFRKDWAGMVRLDTSADLEERMDALVVRRPLRGFDLIQLASALMLRERFSEVFLFACFDDRLLVAARSEGMDVFPGSASPDS